MKKICGKILLLLFVSVFTAATLCANDTPEPSRNRRERGSRSFNRERGGMGGTMFSRLIAEEKIRAAFPEKYAALEAAREKYEAELAKLANDANVQLPAQRDNALRQIRKKFPAEFAELVKKMETSPRQAMDELRKLAEKADVKLFGAGSSKYSLQRRNNGQENNINQRKFSHPDLGKLRQKYPEKMKQYDDLRRDDPQKARKILVEIIEQERNSRK